MQSSCEGRRRRDSKSGVFVCVFLCICVRLSVCAFVFLFVHATVCGCVCVFVHASVCVFLCLCMHLSVHASAHARVVMTTHQMAIVDDVSNAGQWSAPAASCKPDL